MVGPPPGLGPPPGIKNAATPAKTKIGPQKDEVGSPENGSNGGGFTKVPPSRSNARHNHNNNNNHHHNNKSLNPNSAGAVNLQHTPNLHHSTQQEPQSDQSSMYKGVNDAALFEDSAEAHSIPHEAGAQIVDNVTQIENDGVRRFTIAELLAVEAEKQYVLPRALRQDYVRTFPGNVNFIYLQMNRDYERNAHQTKFSNANHLKLKPNHDEFQLVGEQNNHHTGRNEHYHSGRRKSHSNDLQSENQRSTGKGRPYTAEYGRGAHAAIAGQVRAHEDRLGSYHGRKQQPEWMDTNNIYNIFDIAAEQSENERREQHHPENSFSTVDDRNRLEDGPDAIALFRAQMKALENGEDATANADSTSNAETKKEQIVAAAAFAVAHATKSPTKDLDESLLREILSDSSYLQRYDASLLHNKSAGTKDERSSQSHQQQQSSSLLEDLLRGNLGAAANGGAGIAAQNGASGGETGLHSQNNSRPQSAASFSSVASGGSTTSKRRRGFPVLEDSNTSTAAAGTTTAGNGTRKSSITFAELLQSGGASHGTATPHSLNTAEIVDSVGRNDAQVLTEEQIISQIREKDAQAAREQQQQEMARMSDKLMNLVMHHKTKK